MKDREGRWRVSGREPVASDDLATVSTPERRTIGFDAATSAELAEVFRGPPELDTFLASLEAALAAEPEPTADVSRAIRAEAVETLALARAFADPAWGPRGTQFARRMLQLGRLMEALRIHGAHAENVRTGKRTREGAAKGQAARRGALAPRMREMIALMVDRVAAGSTVRDAAKAAVRAGLADDPDTARRAFYRHRADF